MSTDPIGRPAGRRRRRGGRPPVPVAEALRAASNEPLGPVVITPRDIYDVVVTTRDQVSRVADQLVAVRDDLDDHETRLRQLEDVRVGPRITDLAAAVRSLEARQWPLPSAALLVSAAAFLFALLPKITT